MEITLKVEVSLAPAVMDFLRLLNFGPQAPAPVQSPVVPIERTAPTAPTTPASKHTFAQVSDAAIAKSETMRTEVVKLIKEHGAKKLGELEKTPEVWDAFMVSLEALKPSI